MKRPVRNVLLKFKAIISRHLFDGNAKVFVEAGSSYDDQGATAMINLMEIFRQ